MPFTADVGAGLLQRARLVPQNLPVVRRLFVDKPHLDRFMIRPPCSLAQKQVGEIYGS